MKLQELLSEIDYQVISGEKELKVLEIHKIQYDSRKVESGDVFVAIQGTRWDGTDFIPDAVDRGAVAVILDHPEKIRREMGIQILVPDARKALALLSRKYYGYQERKIFLIGITGTKGKTTVDQMVLQGLNSAGKKAGYIGTTHIDTGRYCLKCENTTPESLDIYYFLSEMIKFGCEYAVMEVSSQGLKQFRTEGLTFQIGAFTNLGDDHIGEGEHLDKAEYLACKRRLFFQTKVAIGCQDEAFLEEIWQGTPCEKKRFSYKDSPYSKLSLQMIGAFNQKNAALAGMILEEIGVSKQVIVETLPKVQVAGRMERVEEALPLQVYIDYAHNGESLSVSLKALREKCSGRLLLVFGCGGNRVKSRRWQMGRIAGTFADLTFVTSDNPRYESPMAIIGDIEKGLKETKGKYKKVADRRQAICQALVETTPEDILLIAGKGHENYQEIRGVRYPMSDRKMVKECTQILL